VSGCHATHSLISSTLWRTRARIAIQRSHLPTPYTFDADFCRDSDDRTSLCRSPYQPSQPTTKRHLPRGLDDRTLDQSRPELARSAKSAPTPQVGTLRKDYGDDFAKGCRSDPHLASVRDETGKSLHQRVKKSNG
jgi:hypothetical protein